MLCQECQQRQASVHLTKIINNYKTEVHLCEECARKRDDIIQFTPFSVNDLLAGFMEVGMAQPYEKTGRITCPSCGMNYQQFKKSGLLGCQECYKAFNSKLLPVLHRIQGRTEHSGKVPRRSGMGILMRKEIHRLKSELKKAVETEAFERAAEIRDRIKELERQWSQGGDAK
jgi:protein arginine kinase activator